MGNTQNFTSNCQYIDYEVLIRQRHDAEAPPQPTQDYFRWGTKGCFFESVKVV